MVSLGGVKKAGRRLCVAALLLAAASAVYYFSDEVSFAYREVDGYLPVLRIVRLGALIVAMGLLFALVYPVRVLAVRGPLAVRDRRRSAAASGRPRLTLRLERVLDVLLCLAVLGFTYLLIRPALIEALLPLSGVGWVGRVFTVACMAIAAILVVTLVWLGVGFLPSRRPASTAASAVVSEQTPVAAAAPVADAWPSPSPTTETAPPAKRFCGSCGEANPSVAVFCRSCGAGLGGGPR